MEDILNFNVFTFATLIGIVVVRAWVLLFSDGYQGLGKEQKDINP